MESLVLFLLFIGGLIFSFLALEVEERMYTIILLLIATLCFGFLLIYSQAYLIGLFYILIYSGILSVLFATASNFLETNDKSSPSSNNSIQPSVVED
jgi:NADH:ubiquinone oxidoreductase subunit 6 (subunit J)